MKNPNLGILLFSHEIDKLTDELVVTTKEEHCKKIEALAKRLAKALSLYNKLRNEPGNKAIQKEIMDRYGSKELIAELQRDEVSSEISKVGDE